MPATAKTRTMTAKYDGPCRDCTTPIVPGDLILYTRGFGSIHATVCPGRNTTAPDGSPLEADDNAAECALAAREIADSIAMEAADRAWDRAYAARELADHNRAYEHKMEMDEAAQR